MKKAATIIMVCTLISKLMGFFRELVMSYYFGAGAVTDAFIISQTLPKYLFNFILDGVSACFIPIYLRIKNDSNEYEANEFSNKILTIMLVMSIIVILLVEINTEFIINIVAPGFSSKTMKYAVIFSKITILTIIFSSIQILLMSYLNGNEKFLFPALIGLPSNLVSILFYILAGTYSIYYLPISMPLSTLGMIVLLIIGIRKENYKIKLNFRIKDENVKLLCMNAIPIIIGISANSINKLIDKNLASFFLEGGISSLNYAQLLNNFLLNIFVFSLATVLFSSISRMAAERNYLKMKEKMIESINIVGMLIIPMSIGMMLLSVPIIKFVLLRGAFTEQSVYITGNALFFYSIGTIGYGLREIIVRGFYAISDTKTPLKNSIIGIIVNIILNLILSRYMGLGGLALATSISAIVTTIMLFVSLRKKIGAFGLKGSVITYSKVFVASIIMGVLARFSYDFLVGNLGNTLSLFASIFVGGIVYLVLILNMKIEDVEVVKSMVRDRLRKKIS